MLKTLLAVGLGSMTGGILRYLVSRYLGNIHFPLGTFAVNVVGCLLIGIFYGLFDRGQLMNPQLRLFLTVGLCGGFTTFSTFINENYQMLRMGDFIQLTIYSVSSLLIGLFMLYLGNSIVKSI